MSENSKIEWTDHTFNPWWGCQKVGPGCDHCYAEALDKRTGGKHWGPGAERRRTSIKNWNDPIRWNAKADAFFAGHGRRQRVFCASLADVFDNEVDPVWRNDLFALIARTTNLDWLILTKRIGNAILMLDDVLLQKPRLKTGPCRAASWPWPNVWLGATICNQAEADRDIPKLLAVPAHKRFLSMEPLLGAVDLDRWLEPAGLDADLGLSNPGIDWVIVGGESGPNARPMHPDWALSLRDQCKAAGVPFLFKQWGEWAPRAEWSYHTRLSKQCAIKFDGSDVRHDDAPQDVGGHRFEMVGKKAAGRLLDGREWNGAPA